MMDSHFKEQPSFALSSLHRLDTPLQNDIMAGIALHSKDDCEAMVDV